MSLAELYRLAKGKHKSSQQNAAICIAEPQSPPRSDFAELVWENGPVVMQGQPNRARKPNSGNIRTEDLPKNSSLRDKGLVKGDGSLGMMESSMNEFQIHVPSELDEHDDMVPWLRYHMDEDEPVQLNYNSDFYQECSGVSAHNLLKDTNMDSHQTHVQNPASFELPIRSKVSQLDQLSSRRGLCSFPSFRPKGSDTISNCPSNGMQKLFLGDSAQKHYSSSVYPRMKMQTQDLGHQLPTSTIMNFSHFSKHTCMVKSSVDTSSTKAGPEVSVIKQMDGKEIGSVFTGAKPVDPSQISSISCQQRDGGYHSQLALLSTVDGSKLSISKPLEIPLSANHSRLACCQDSKIIDVPPKQAVVPNGNTATGNVEKTTEPVVASSVCSGNSADRASNDPTYSLKRKNRECEDSEYRSEDIEEESVGIRKADTNRIGSGSKRSRAAEVHNLSERRRRDRINEKMRALQELIPNCNKVDKASMLDEAIEYLKTLQLQLQMMSMRPSLCMPPVMLPQAAHMPRFSPMSVGMGMGMGMGMGYGLGMLDMNGNPSNYQLVQMPSVPGTRFPMAPVPGLGNLTAAPPLPNLSIYGYQGQGIGIPMSCAPATSYAPDLPSRPVMDPNSTNSVLPVGDLGLAQTSQVKDMVKNVTLDEIPKTDDNLIQGLITNQAKMMRIFSQRPKQ